MFMLLVCIVCIFYNVQTSNKQSSSQAAKQFSNNQGHVSLLIKSRDDGGMPEMCSIIMFQ
jgi:hypothetical protein